jgi:hypothetical protein
MGIETKYEYIYYTVVNINDYINTENFTWEKAIDIINKKFKESKDQYVCNFRVDGGWYCGDVDHWIRAQCRHKVRPVFLQFEDNQPITLTGSGQMFELYEEEDVRHNRIDDNPDAYYGLDGLAGLGGRL